MRATTVRFSDDLWELLETEASHQGISAAQFVRDAALMRLGILSSRRGDLEAALTLEKVAAGALTGRHAGADPRGGVISDPGRLAELRATGLLDTRRGGVRPVHPCLPPPLLRRPDRPDLARRRGPPVLQELRRSPRALDRTRETPLTHSFCQHAWTRPSRSSSTTPATHPLVRDNLAIRDLDVIAYAGIPLITAAGHSLGSLCVIDHRPRAWTAEEIDTLAVLAASVVSEIELATSRASG